MHDRRVRAALRDALNGDADTLDPAVRRGLFVLAVAQDDIDDKVGALAGSVKQIRSEFEGLRRTVVVTGGGIVTTVVGCTAAIISRL